MVGVGFRRCGHFGEDGHSQSSGNAIGLSNCFCEWSAGSDRLSRSFNSLCWRDHFACATLGRGGPGWRRWLRSAAWRYLTSCLSRSSGHFSSIATDFDCFGKVYPAAGLFLTLAIYAIQIPLSVWWLRHFRFGPMEWIWRSLTYGKLQPMRL